MGKTVSVEGVLCVWVVLWVYKICCAWVVLWVYILCLEPWSFWECTVCVECQGSAVSVHSLFSAWVVLWVYIVCLVVMWVCSAGLHAVSFMNFETVQQPKLWHCTGYCYTVPVIVTLYRLLWHCTGYSRPRNLQQDFLYQTTRRHVPEHKYLLVNTCS
jgi:hypothetical protein